MNKKIIFTFLTILWMVLIFAFSNQKAVASTENSQSFIRSTIINVYKIFNSNATEEQINEIVEKYDTPVRKLAHFTEYFVLGVLVCLMFKAYGIKNSYLMIIVCFLYACSDEIHQLFVPGRNGNVIDVVIDSVGSTLSIIIFNRK